MNKQPSNSHGCPYVEPEPEVTGELASYLHSQHSQTHDKITRNPSSYDHTPLQQLQRNENNKDKYYATSRARALEYAEVN